MGVTLESLRFHTHYDGDGIQVAHDVGHVYEVCDGQGMTAEQLAASFVAAGIAKRVESGSLNASVAAPKTRAVTVSAEAPATRTTAVEPMSTDAAPLVTPKARNRTTATPRATKAISKAKGKARR